MTDLEFLKAVAELNQIHEDHNEFYELAEKYGFCTPWCDKPCRNSQNCKNEE